MNKLTKTQLSYDLLNIRNLSESADDNSALRQMGFWIDNTRAFLLSQDYDKKHTINPDNVQTLPCEQVIEIDRSLCPCEVVDCTILRTKNQMPNFLETNYKNLLLRVKSVDIKSMNISIVEFPRVPFIGANKFSKNLSVCFIHNHYIYILSNVFIDKISVEGVFETPEELLDYKSCTGQSCYTPDMPYPMSRTMVDMMKKLIADTNFRLTKELVDAVNNAKDDYKSNIS